MKSTVQRARAGDSGAREAVVRCLTSRVNSCSRYYSRRCGVDVDDLRQEMWLGVFEALQRVDVSIGDPIQFLLSHGRFALLTSLRRRRKCSAGPDEAAEQVPVEGSLERNVIDGQVVQGFVSSLDTTAHRIVSCLLQGHSRSETAKLLGCTPANITYHLRRVESSLSALLAAESRAAYAGGAR